MSDTAVRPGTLHSDLWWERLLGIVAGQTASAMIESWVDSAWVEGRFAVAVPEDSLVRLPSRGRPVARYGESGVLRSEVCFRHPEGPGGVVVHTPAMEARTRFCVAPHRHPNAHVTVVLRGEANFFIARGTSGDGGVARVPVRPGSVLLCPAGVAHTFGSRNGPFSVPSLQARYVDPSLPDFAENVDAFDGRPVLRSG